MPSQFKKATSRRVLSIRRSGRTQPEFHSSPSSSPLKPTRIASSRPAFNRHPDSSILGLATSSTMLYTAMTHQQHKPRVCNLLRDSSTSGLVRSLRSLHPGMSRRSVPRSHRWSFSNSARKDILAARASLDSTRYDLRSAVATSPSESRKSRTSSRHVSIASQFHTSPRTTTLLRTSFSSTSSIRLRPSRSASLFIRHTLLAWLRHKLLHQLANWTMGFLSLVAIHQTIDHHNLDSLRHTTLHTGFSIHYWRKLHCTRYNWRLYEELQVYWLS